MLLLTVCSELLHTPVTRCKVLGEDTENITILEDSTR